MNKLYYTVVDWNGNRVDDHDIQKINNSKNIGLELEQIDLSINIQHTLILNVIVEFVTVDAFYIKISLLNGRTILAEYNDPYVPVYVGVAIEVFRFITKHQNKIIDKYSSSLTH